jgi:Cu(I)-responsive transcriptional regulator
MTALSIGEVSKQTGLGVDTIRFYEKEKLIPPPPRSHSGYRIYSTEIVERICFIQRAKTLGFTLSEIADLLSLRANPESSAAEVKQKALRKIDAIENKIRNLKEIQKELKALAATCSGTGTVDTCPIIEGIESKPMS